MEPAALIFICSAAFLAGLIDAVVGGGGLIQIPALFNILPSTVPPATVFGTNKLASIFGTSSAALRYSRRIETPWTVALPAALAAFCLSYFGAMAVSLLPKESLRPVVFLLLVAVTAYTYARKDLGAEDQQRVLGRKDMVLAVLFGSLIGFYDGFFGPGTGSFLIFVFVRFFGLDFLRASASAKIVNAATNLAALLYFGASGNIFWWQGLTMAYFNVAGALLGSQLALQHGTAFVRRVFLLVASILIVKFAWDTLY